MVEAAVLGTVQGVTEWLPVSSEGMVAVAASWLFGRTFAEAVAFALWLHLGTAFSALLVFRGELAAAVRDLLTAGGGRGTAPKTAFLVVATVVSGAVGLPLLAGLSAAPDAAGSGAMAAVGAAMLVSARLQRRRPEEAAAVRRRRTRDDLRLGDALLTGAAQGLAVVPGMSRSGATVAALLARGVDRREALVMSFVLSVPASLGAAVYAAATPGVELGAAAALSAFVAGAAGVATIRGSLAVASRVSLAGFTGGVGLLVIAGAAVQWLTQRPAM